MVFAGVPALLIDFADRYLHAGVVFGFYDAVGRRAFTGDITFQLGQLAIKRVKDTAVGTRVEWGEWETGGGRLKRTIGIRAWEKDIQIDELAFIVLHDGQKVEGNAKVGFLLNVAGGCWLTVQGTKIIGGGLA